MGGKHGVFVQGARGRREVSGRDFPVHFYIVDERPRLANSTAPEQTYKVSVRTLWCSCVCVCVFLVSSSSQGPNTCLYVAVGQFFVAGQIALEMNYTEPGFYTVTLPCPPYVIYLSNPFEMFQSCERKLRLMFHICLFVRSQTRQICGNAGASRDRDEEYLWTAVCR